MKKIRIRFFKFSDGKQNLQFHWPYSRIIHLIFQAASGPCIIIINFFF
jgi:hypothetical protein